MKAFILLCMLYSAFGKSACNPYIWNPRGSPDSARECRADQGSCGCCTILREVDKLREHFDQSLSELEEEYQKANQSFNNIQASRTAFSGALADDAYRGCMGPHNEDKVIKYNYVLINLNNGYNQTTGIFTAPCSGFYSIAFTVYSDAGSAGSSLEACAVLMVDNENIGGVTDRNQHDQEDSTSHVIALKLQEGSKVAVILPAGCFLCDDSSRYNTFSVFLIYATE
ncbi:complement C1q-like protein 3 [Notolabrus celidotus]|uniref:complement C1q-like protein 3 n=1 Tax=Notolabrus celidotus TaxID=1203425 RepID=UPI00149005D7|nr:complement C1q-like protein 3 [Notolabrus celidotus]